MATVTQENKELLEQWGLSVPEPATARQNLVDFVREDSITRQERIDYLTELQRTYVGRMFRSSNDARGRPRSGTIRYIYIQTEKHNVQRQRFIGGPAPKPFRERTVMCGIEWNQYYKGNKQTMALNSLILDSPQRT